MTTKVPHQPSIAPAAASPSGMKGNHSNSSAEGSFSALGRASALFALLAAGLTSQWTNAQDTEPALLTSADMLVVAEGANTSFSVELASRPSVPVAVYLTVSSEAISIDEDTLVFTLPNWRVPQVVTVSSMEDQDGADELANIRLTAAGGEYTDVAAVTIEVTVEDDDKGSIDLYPPELLTTELPLTENVGLMGWQLKLTDAPDGEVRIRVVSSDPSVVTVNTGTGRHRVFGPDNWDQTWTLRVRGVDNGLIDSPHRTATVINEVVESTASNYPAGMDIGTIRVKVVDDDDRHPRLDVAGAPATLNEGGTATITVKMSAFPPKELTTVALTSSDSSRMTVSPSMLTFDPLNDFFGFYFGYTVTITGHADDDDEDSPVQLHMDRMDGNLQDVIYDTQTVDVMVEEGSGVPQGTVPLVPPASDPQFQGFVRVINRDSVEASVLVEAFDDEGMPYGPLSLSVPAFSSRHFNSGDLEMGNTEKELSGSTGQGSGNWRLNLTSTEDVEVLSYVRTTDGFLTAMRDVLAVGPGTGTLPTFNPGRNDRQVSDLRLINISDSAATVTIVGVDDAGQRPGAGATATIPAGASRTYSAAALESGGAAGLSGSIGVGMGKWRLELQSDETVLAMSLMSTPTGHLTNLTSMAPLPGADGRHFVPMFPSASDADGRQGFVRLVNRSDAAGEVTVQAHNETGAMYDLLTVAMDAGETKHFNSDDLEYGNVAKRITGSTGRGVGNWWLQVTSDLNLQVLSYIRTTTDGFLTSMHDVAPSIGQRYRVPTLNPGRNVEQAGSVRLLNPGSNTVWISLSGIDDMGEPGLEPVYVQVPGMQAIDLTALALEAGDGLQGAFGTPDSGRWRVEVGADQPIRVLSLISNATGHLTNLSTAPDR